MTMTPSQATMSTDTVEMTLVVPGREGSLASHEWRRH